MTRQPGQDVAGVLLAAPAFRQRRSRLQPDAGVSAGDLPDDVGGAVLGVVVEDDDLDLDPVAGQGCLDGGADGAFLIAGRYEDGDGPDGLRLRGRPVEPEVDAEEHGR